MTEPVSITVDRLFAILDDALADAIVKGGNKAKSVAWDVRGHFLGELGHYRSGAQVDRSRNGQDAERLDAKHESAVPKGCAQTLSDYE